MASRLASSQRSLKRRSPSADANVGFCRIDHSHSSSNNLCSIAAAPPLVVAGRCADAAGGALKTSRAASTASIKLFHFERIERDLRLSGCGMNELTRDVRKDTTAEQGGKGRRGKRGKGGKGEKGKWVKGEEKAHSFGSLFPSSPLPLLPLYPFRFPVILPLSDTGYRPSCI